MSREQAEDLVIKRSRDILSNLDDDDRNIVNMAWAIEMRREVEKKVRWSNTKDLAKGMAVLAVAIVVVVPLAAGFGKFVRNEDQQQELEALRPKAVAYEECALDLQLRGARIRELESLLPAEP